MDSTIDDTDILSKLKHYRKNILLLLYRHGELRTREIREQTSIPKGSKDHHFGILEDWGLIEVVGHAESGGGIPERVFGLTEAGTAFVDDHLTGNEERPDSYEMRLDRAEDEISRLEGKVEQLESTVEQQADTIASLQEMSVDQEEFDNLVDQLRTDYWDSIIDEIDNRTSS